MLVPTLVVTALTMNTMSSLSGSMVPSSYPNWRDLPVGADTITMLDGDDWTVTGAGRAFAKKCTGGSTAGPE